MLSPPSIFSKIFVSKIHLKTLPLKERNEKTKKNVIDIGDHEYQLSGNNSRKKNFQETLQEEDIITMVDTPYRKRD